QNAHAVPVCTTFRTTFLRRRRMVRNLRIVRLSIFNKLLKAQDLRNGVFVRVLPEEPFLFNHFPALRATVGAPLYPNCPRSLLGPSFAGIATTLSLTVFTYLWVRSSADCKATSSPIAYQPEHAVGFVPGDFHRDA